MKYKFKYKIVNVGGGELSLVILEQSDEICYLLKKNLGVYKAKNGWEIESESVPEVDKDFKCIYIKGTEPDQERKNKNLTYFPKEYKNDVVDALEDFKKHYNLVSGIDLSIETNLFEL